MKATAHTDAQWNLASEMKGKRIFVTFDVAKLRSMATEKYSNENFTRWLQLFERLNFSMTDAHDMQLELVAPKGTDILKEIKN